LLASGAPVATTTTTTKENLMFHVMGTGSRSMVVAADRLSVYDDLRNHILRLRNQHPDLVLISGMAEGWDEAIAKVGMRENIPFHAYVPNPEYGAYYWGQHSLTGRNRMSTFNELLAAAEKVVYVAQTLYVAGVHANFVRNQAMVDVCNMALVYQPSDGGTADTVRRLTTTHKPFVVYPFA
jgi:hypothetical protein